MNPSTPYPKLAILGVLSAFLLAGCAPTAPAPKSGATTTAPTVQSPASPESKAGSPAPIPKPSADQPRYGGVLAVTTMSDPPSLDPQMEGTASLTNVIGPVYSGLLQYDPLDNEKIVPDLAERWESSGDGTVYTFYLRKDVKWHDGKPFTSVDAKFSLERLPKYYVRKRDALEPVSQIDTPDDYSVKVTLKYPTASLPATLAAGTMPMGPKHFIEAKGDLRKEAMGTGPFKFKNYSFGVSLEVTKNKDYFIPGRPYLDGIVAYIVKDKATRFAAFRTGQVKMNVPIARFSPSEAKTIQKDLPSAVLQQFQGLTGAVFFINMIQKPWDDIRVRRAVHLATDRQAAIKAVGEGEGTLGGAMIAGQWAIPEDELLKQPGYRQPKDADVAEAKRLLAEAALPAGWQPKILTRAGYADYLKVAEFMTDQLSKVGIRAVVDAQESAIYTDRLNRSSYETMATTPTLDFADPDSAALYFVKGNRYMISDEKLFDLFARQARTTDPSERKRIVVEMQYRVLEIAPYVVNLWLPSYIAFWPEVRNYKTGVGQYNNSKYQDVWLAK